MIHAIRVECIRFNPWQPRLRENTEKVEQLAESLLENVDRLPTARRGLLQVPLARVVDLFEQPIECGRTHGALLELAERIEVGEALAQLAFGHRRYKAFRQLAAGGQGRKPDERFAAMPLELAALTDRQMAELAFRENVEREDLTWYEIAKSVNRFTLNFDATQEELAEVFGFGTRGTVANYIRALRIIEEFGDQGLEQLALDGYLPLKHVLHLAPLMRDFPDTAHVYLEEGRFFTEEGEVRPASAVKAEIDRLLALLREEDEEPEPDEDDTAERFTQYAEARGLVGGGMVSDTLPEKTARQDDASSPPGADEPAPTEPAGPVVWPCSVCHQEVPIEGRILHDDEYFICSSCLDKGWRYNKEGVPYLWEAAAARYEAQQQEAESDDDTLPAWLADDAPPAIDRTLDALSFTVFRLAEAVGGLQDALEGAKTVEDEAILEHALRVASTAVNPVREMLGTLIRPEALDELRGKLAGIEDAEERRKVIANFLWERKPVTRVVGPKDAPPALQLAEPEDTGEVVA